MVDKAGEPESWAALEQNQHGNNEVSAAMSHFGLKSLTGFWIFFYFLKRKHANSRSENKFFLKKQQHSWWQALW